MLDKIEAQYKCVLVFIILIGSFIMLVNGVKKSGNYFIDEQYSYRTANSKERMDLYDLEFSWVTPEILKKYVSVQKDQQFSYDTPYDNAVKDFHPPLYFYLLHTICSFFPNQYSKWFPLSINMLFYILTIFGLFLLSDCLFKSKKKALLTSAIWAFSLGAISTFLLARMYMVLTAWTVFTLYFTVKYYLEKNKLYLWGILISFFLAGLTHYYFWILGFCITLVFFLLNKDVKTKLAFSVTTLFSFVSVCLYFPKTILQFLDHNYANYRVDEAISNLPNFSNLLMILNKFLLYFKGNFSIVNLQLRTLILIIVFFILVCFLKFIVYFFKNEKIYNDKSNNFKFFIKLYQSLKDDIQKTFSNQNKIQRVSFFIVIIPSLLCAYVILAIEPFLVDRYIFFLFPVEAVIITIFLSFAYSKIKQWQSLSKFFFTICLILIIMVSNKTYFQQSWYIYEGGSKYEEFNETLKDAHVLYVMDRNDYEMHNMAYSYSLIKEIFFMKSYMDNWKNYDYKKIIIGQIQNHIPQDEKTIVVCLQELNGAVVMNEDVDFLSVLDQNNLEINLLYRDIGVINEYTVYEIKKKAELPQLNRSVNIYQYLDILSTDIMGDKQYSILIGVKDEAAVSINDNILNRLSALGLQQSLEKQFHHPYLAVIDEGNVVYESLGADNSVILGYSGVLLDGTKYDMYSEGTVEGRCSINIEGLEYAPNFRGLNFVVYDNEAKKVIDSVVFDTYSPNLKAIRLYF
jgi:hypothetical protein